MDFNRVSLTIGMLMLAALLSACGNIPEEIETPAAANEQPAVTEEINSSEAETEPETETVPETEITTAETTAEETTEAASETETVPDETDASPGQDGSWASGVWKPVDDDEMYVFTPQGQATILREMDTAWYDEYMRFENGEITLTEKTVSAYGELTEITRDEDIGNFRIYSYAAFLEDGLEGMPVRYVLDKDGKLYVLYSDIVNFRYEASSDSLTLILGEEEEDNETSMVEIIDSEHVNLTAETYGETYTVSLAKIPHLDAVVNYLN